ncbi:arabinose 5-phosphate isomerase [Pycnococcus provasolii]
MSPASHPASNEGLQDLFNEQRKLMDYFFDNLEYEPLANFCKEIMACKGVVFFSGVGKSGFIAQKISMTLVSTGTKAVFLNPTDALHGDIGIVSENDLLVLFSKSGSTSELLTLIPYARAKGAKLIGVSSVKGSKLDVACDMHVHLPLERELCPFDLAPVTSTAIQMLFGDTVAIALMKERNLTQEEYAKNHPAGRIGKRLLLKVSDVMNAKDLPFVKKDVKVIDSLVELSSKGAGCVLVVGENNVLEGTFTDGDLRRALQSKGSSVLEQPLEMVATKTPRTINEDAMAVEAMKSMEEPTKVTFLPVVNDSKQVTGIITLHGLVTAGL